MLDLTLWTNILKEFKDGTPLSAKKEGALSYFNTVIKPSSDYQKLSQSEQNRELYTLLQTLAPKKQITPKEADVDVIAGSVPSGEEPWSETLKAFPKEIKTFPKRIAAATAYYLAQKAKQTPIMEEKIFEKTELGKEVKTSFQQLDNEVLNALEKWGQEKYKEVEEYTKPTGTLTVEQSLLRSAAKTLPQRFVAVGALFSGQPALAAIISGGVMFPPIYTEARQRGVPHVRAEASASIQSLIEGLGDIPAFQGLTNVATSPFVRILNFMMLKPITEGGEEFLQKGVEAVVEEKRIPSLQEMSIEGLQAAIITMLLAAPEGAIGISVQEIGKITDKNKLLNLTSKILDFAEQKTKEERGTWGAPEYLNILRGLKEEQPLPQEIADKLIEENAFVLNIPILNELRKKESLIQQI